MPGIILSSGETEYFEVGGSYTGVYIFKNPLSSMSYDLCPLLCKLYANYKEDIFSKKSTKENGNNLNTVYIFKVQLTPFVDDLGVGVRQKEESRGRLQNFMPVQSSE